MMEPFMSWLVVALTFGLGDNPAALPPLVVQEASSSDAVGDPVRELGSNLMLVYQDQKKNYWFATWGDGVYRTDGKTIVHFTAQHGLPHNRIDDILEDAAGNLYFNTREGISRFDGKTFSTLPLTGEGEWALGATDLWFKSSHYSGEIFRFDGRRLHTLTLPKVASVEQFIAKHPQGPNPYAVYFIYRDRHQHVWFGTAAAGVCRYDGKKFDWLSSPDVHELHEGPSNGVRSIVQDRSGNFWFTTKFRYGLVPPVDKSDEAVEQVGPFYRLPGIGSLDGRKDGDFLEYMSIVQDDSEGVWIATYQGGVFHYDGNLIRHYPIREGSVDVKLFTIYKDRDGGLWLGTHENGAFRWDGKAFIRYRPAGG